jgi:SRSO17 transposase
MKTDRHYTGVAKETGVEPQNMPHFMSNSPWSAEKVYDPVQDELQATPALTEGDVLLVDESADEKASGKTAGAAKQYNGRMGKVEISQVGVFLCYANLNVPQGFWTWIRGKLFLPEDWFEQGEEQEELRKKLGIPASLTFKTKVELAWEMIETVLKRGLQTEIIAFDSLYGRSSWLRKKIRKIVRIYMAEVPSDTPVYLEEPVLGVPERKSNRGKAPSKLKVLNTEAVRVDSLHEQIEWEVLHVRAIERGELRDPFQFWRVWTVEDDEAVPHWRVIRQETEDKISYALCNARADTPKQPLAWWKCQRYFIERANQDAKSELGWDELQAQKYRAFEHHLAMTVLASWFVAFTKFEWARDYPRDPKLLDEFEVDVLPALSMSNVRELLCAVMPLKQLTPLQATELVVEHFINRIRSRKSRLKNQRIAEAEMPAQS